MGTLACWTGIAVKCNLLVLLVDPACFCLRAGWLGLLAGGQSDRLHLGVQCAASRGRQELRQVHAVHTKWRGKFCC
jgi:hypothetical protein